MADEMRVEVVGLEDVVDALRELGADMESAVEAIALAAAEPMARTVAAKAPGKIGDAIVTETTEKSKSRVTVSVGPSRKAWIARFVEFGTGAHTVTARKQRALKLYGLNIYRKRVEVVGVAARPFMRPAFDTGQSASQTAAANAAKKVIE